LVAAVGREDGRVVARVDEVLLVGLPLEEAVPLCPGLLRREGHPPLGRVVAQVVEVQVAGAAGDVGVQDRAPVGDLRGDALGLAGVEHVVAELHLDPVAGAGQPRHEQEQHARHEHAAESEDDGAPGAESGAAFDRHGDGGGSAARP